MKDEERRLTRTMKRRGRWRRRRRMKRKWRRTLIGTRRTKIERIKR